MGNDWGKLLGIDLARNAERERKEDRMGTSTNAILFYGFPILDEDGNESEAARTPEARHNLDRIQQIVEEADADETEEIAGKFLDGWNSEAPAIIGDHCSGECPMYYVYARASQTQARRGYPEQIDSKGMDGPHPGWDEDIRKFCESAGLKMQPCSWWLVSMWS